MRFNSKQFGFSPKFKSLVADFEELGIHSFPESVEVLSARTGAVASFSVDSQEYYENEGWDGVQMVYRPEVECGVEKLVIISG